MIAGLILDGGRGLRFGGIDKAFLLLQGRPLIDHVADRVAPQLGRNIAISANGDARRFAAYPFPVLPDAQEFAGKGPLAGIAAGLAWADSIGAHALLTIPVDTPLFPNNLAAVLQPAPAVTCYRGRQHHLVALWPVTFRDALVQFLTAPNVYRVRAALDLCGARRVDFTAETDPFANINTPEDLEAAIARS